MRPRARIAKSVSMPRPVLKWAGGKTQLLPELLPRVIAAMPFGRYHEPFVGGGALFFELCRNGRLGGAPALLSDVNDRLMETYRTLRDQADGVVDLLKVHRSLHSRDHYYAVRAEVPEDPVQRAARFIYLNRTCFNGLYRENSRGQFNVPMGRYAAPLICDEGNLRAVSKALRGAELASQPFTAVLDAAAPGDLVYFDPPYVPLSRTSSFTRYAKGGFGVEDQRALAEVFAALDRKGVKVILSNSHTPLVHELYAPFPKAVVSATRALNSRPDRRGAIEEVLVTNFG